MFGFRWFKKKEKTYPRATFIGMKEIIWTTARCRAGVYYEWGLGNISEQIAQNVYNEYEKLYGVHPITTNIIDKVQEMFQKEELRQIEIGKLWKGEYGM